MNTEKIKAALTKDEGGLVDKIASIIDDAISNETIRFMGRERTPYLPTESAWEIGREIMKEFSPSPPRWLLRLESCGDRYACLRIISLAMVM